MNLTQALEWLAQNTAMALLCFESREHVYLSSTSNTIIVERSGEESKLSIQDFRDQYHSDNFRPLLIEEY